MMMVEVAAHPTHAHKHKLYHTNNKATRNARKAAANANAYMCVYRDLEKESNIKIILLQNYMKCPLLNVMTNENNIEVLRRNAIQ
jgi:putative IMPACT (imprinted ancient) family translation regulator